jgi:hypothetical protein
MSLMGHSLPIHLAPVPANVRYYPVVSTDRRNTLSLKEKMECDDGSEVSSRI